MSRHVRDNERYSILIEPLDFCCMCGAYRTDLHEVFSGPNRQASKDYGLVIPLCRRCHELIHKNSAVRRKWQEWAQRAFEKRYGHDKFMEVFRKNYL